MSLHTETRSGLARDLGLVGWQIRYEQRSYWRNRGRGLFTFAFPLMFLVIFASLDSSAHIKSLGGISYDDFLVPGILAYAVITTTFVNLAISTAILRDEGVLKRMQGTPLPRWAYVAARIGSCALVMAAITIVVVLAGVIFWGLTLRLEALPAIAVTLLLGTAAFTTLGIGILRFVKNADTAPVIVNLFPTNTLPHTLRSIASAFPIKPLASSLQYAFDPRHHGAAFDWGSLRTLLIWAAVGTFLMVRFLRRPLGDDVP
jgi:ABC-2 type transport system permease protein